ncbi:MAG: hypothetical protein HY079_04190 [Elusimicrobia bacterium]|nr:hypothetical protein [Elusimicrobiota bacterium]
MSVEGEREECAAPAKMAGSAPFLRIAPPLSVPLRHFALGAAAFLVFAVRLVLRPDDLVGFGFSAKSALGLVHVLTLGWVAQTVLGAWTQMIPVHGETPLASVRAAKAGWWLFVAGVVSFVGLLWSGSDRYWVGASVAYAGVLVELSNLAVTHARAVRRDWTWVHFTTALAWLALLGLVGVLMAVDRHRATVFRDPDGGLIAHVHMALAGFVGTTVFGAGYRLFPWVAMHQLRSRWEGRLSFALLQLGLAGLALDGLFGGRRLTALWAVMLAASYLLYFAQMRPLLKAGPALDPSLATLLCGMLGGAAWAALGVGLATGLVRDEPAARAAYAWTALLGFFTPVILSQVHKIAPFLVWLHVYSPRQWTPPVTVPKIDDLTSRGLAWGEAAALAAAVPLGAAGLWRESETLVRAAGLALLLCAGLFAWNTARLLLHVLRPDGRWTLPGA